MVFSRRALPLVVLITLATAAAHAGQAPAAAARVELTPEQMEAFLLHATIVRTRSVSTGVNDTRRATLSDGTLTHDAQIQDVDITRATFQAGKASEINFKDSYRFNIAGYRLARLLGMDNVPMSVERVIQRKTAAVTWWIDDVQMDEKERVKRAADDPDPQRYNQQLAIMRVWDELIQNRDRNQGNILWTSDWKMWLIDHTRAFRLGRALVGPNTLRRCERGMFARMRDLTPSSVAGAMGSALTNGEIEALLARRDAIVKVFDGRIKETSEPAVLFTLAPVRQ